MDFFLKFSTRFFQTEGRKVFVTFGINYNQAGRGKYNKNVNKLYHWHCPDTYEKKKYEN